MEFHWWYIPVWLLLVALTGYIWGAFTTMGCNDFKRRRNKVK